MLIEILLIYSTQLIKDNFQHFIINYWDWIKSFGLNWNKLSKIHRNMCQLLPVEGVSSPYPVRITIYYNETEIRNL